MSAQISREDRGLTVAASFVVGAIFAFLTFAGIMLVVEASFVNFSIACGLSLVVQIVVPFIYQSLGRSCVLTLAKLRHNVFQDTLKPWSEAGLVQLSIVAPLIFVFVALWYLGVDFFNHQWSPDEWKSNFTNPSVNRNSKRA